MFPDLWRSSQGPSSGLFTGSAHQVRFLGRYPVQGPKETSVTDALRDADG